MNNIASTIHHGLTRDCPTPNPNGSCPGHPVPAHPTALETLERVRDWLNNHAREMMHVGPSNASEFLHDAISETQEVAKDVEAAIRKLSGAK